MATNLDLALRIRSDLRGAVRDLDRLERELGQTDRAARRSGRSLRGVGDAGRTLRNVLAGAGLALAIRQITRASDEYTNLRSQLRLVTGSQEELNEVFNSTAALAQETRQALGPTVGLFARLKRSTEELSLSNEDLLTVTRAINQSFVVSGSRAQEAAAATLQLSQGLASGTLRGEELNSVLENSPRLARAIADGLGVTIGQLRELGAEGQLTASALLQALLRTADGIDTEFKRLPRTVGQALQQLRTDLLLTFGQADTGPLIEGIDDLRELVTDPEFQRSVISLANGILRLVGAAGRLVEFGEFALQDFGLISVDENDLRDLRQQESLIRDLMSLGQLDPRRIRGSSAGGFEFFDDQELELALRSIRSKIQSILNEEVSASIVRQVQNPIADATRGLDDALNSSGTLLEDTAGEKLLEEQEKFVAALEAEAAQAGKTEAQVRRMMIAELELTGALQDRAEAAATALEQEEEAERRAEQREKQEEQRRQDQEQVDGLQARLLRAQGDTAGAIQAEFEAEFGELMQRLEERSDEAGLNVVNGLLDLELLGARLTEAEREIDQALAEQGRREQSIDTERQAGLISEADARRQILELHRETAAALEDQRPILEELAEQPGQVGEAARRALAQMDGQLQRLRSTTTLLEETLRTGIESGLSDAILGLAQGTETLGGAIRSLGQSVAQALAEMAAAEIASSITAGVFGGGGGGGSGGSLGGIASIGASLFAAEGGAVRGPGTGTSDSIPAMLSAGEFVTRAKVAQQPGAMAFLQDFNQRGLEALRDFMPRQATGGLAGEPAPPAPPPTLGRADLPEPANAFSASVSNNLRLNLIDDPARISDALQSRAGEEALTVMLSKNPAKFRQLLRLPAR